MSGYDFGFAPATQRAEEANPAVQVQIFLHSLQVLANEMRVTWQVHVQQISSAMKQISVALDRDLVPSADPADSPGHRPFFARRRYGVDAQRSPYDIGSKHR